MRKMKDSKIEWVDEIPEEWSVAKLKHIISLLTDYTANGSFGDLAKNVEYLDYKDYARLVRLTDLRDNLQNDGVYVSKESYQYLSKSKLFGGETLIANVGAYAGLFCEMPKFNDFATLGPNMFLLRTNERLLQHYLLYLGNADFVWVQLMQKSISSAQPKLNKTDVKTVYIVFPPLDEQQRIADFLDGECERIDGLKADIEKQIETLEKYKRSVITEAVTHGLDPATPMKESKVWYGQIPQSWTDIKGKYIFTQRNGRGNHIDLQLLSPTQKHGVIPQDMYEELSGMSAVKLNDNTNFAMLKTIHKGDYCISLRSFQGGFEYSEYEGVVSPAYQVFYPIVPTCSGYYKYLFKRVCSTGTVFKGGVERHPAGAKIHKERPTAS